MVAPAVSPRFSILWPLPGHRGIALETLDTWVSRQTLPRELFQVIVVSDGSEPALVERIGRRLAPHDRQLVVKSDNFSLFYDRAARAAGGDFLVFTESHVYAEPDFLEQLDRYLHVEACAGACCRTEPICPDTFARLDAVLHEEGFRLYRQEGDWRKVNVHAFALRRDVYLAAGGLDHRYDRFAEMLLAAGLRDRGVKLGYAERAAVRHLYRSPLGETAEDVDRFVRGESLYRAEHPGVDRVGYTFFPALHEENVDLAREVCRVLRRDVLRRALWQGDRLTLAALARARAAVRRHGRRGYLRAAVRMRWLMFRCCCLRGDLRRLDPVYRELWQAAARVSRLRFLLKHPLRPRGTAGPASCRIDEIAAEAMFGFHPLESYQGESFRWTGRVAAVRLHLPPERCEVRIDTRELRQAPLPLRLRLYCNGRRLGESEVTVADGVIRATLDEDASRLVGASLLVLTCNPLQPWKQGIPDRRELGIPIFSIHCATAAAARPRAA